MGLLSPRRETAPVPETDKYADPLVRVRSEGAFDVVGAPADSRAAAFSGGSGAGSGIASLAAAGPSSELVVLAGGAGDVRGALDPDRASVGAGCRAGAIGALEGAGAKSRSRSAMAGTDIEIVPVVSRSIIGVH